MTQLIMAVVGGILLSAFFETYGITSYGTTNYVSGWRKDGINWYLEFGPKPYSPDRSGGNGFDWWLPVGILINPVISFVVFLLLLPLWLIEYLYKL